MKRLLPLLLILITSIGIFAGVLAYSANKYSLDIPFGIADYSENQKGVSSGADVSPIAIVTPRIVAAPTVVVDEVEITEEEELSTIEPDILIVDHSGFEYAYSQMGDGGKQLYDVVYSAIVNYGENVTVPTLDIDLLDKVFNCVTYDHPEIFYVSGYKYTKMSRGDVLRKITFTANYTYTKDERDSIWNDLDIAANSILAGVPVGSDYDRIKYIYDAIVLTTEYDTASPDNQNIISVLLNHVSVCQGYAKTMQLLLNRLNIPTTLIIGTVKSGEGHAWNMVKADGNWYLVDCTWGDAFYKFTGGDEAPSTDNFVNYDYLCATDNDISRTHFKHMPYSLPVCDSLECNYYHREGLYFEGFNEEAMSAAFDRAYSMGRQELTIKASNEWAYNNLVEELMNNQRIFDFMSGSKQVRYGQNTDTLTLTFWL